MLLLGLLLPPSIPCVRCHVPPSCTDFFLFPSHCSATCFLLPQTTRLRRLIAFMARCWRVLSARTAGWSLPRGAARGGEGESVCVGSRAGSGAPGAKPERAGGSPEIFTFNLFASFPSKSADAWKRGITAKFACFSKFPLSPVPLPARHGSARLAVAPARWRAPTGRKRKVSDSRPAAAGRPGARGNE